MRKTLITILIFVLLAGALTVRPYANQYRVGLAWDWGGVEVLGEPGLWLCSSSPLSEALPHLIADC